MSKNPEAKGSDMSKPGDKIRDWIETADHIPPTTEEAIKYGWLPERRVGLADRRK